VTVDVLRHIREIEVRRLFIDLGYSSMYAYCLKRLKYSEGQASRRLASARLLTELPEIEKRIEDGDLSLTNLSKIQSFVRAEKSANFGLSKDEKLELISEFENKSTRQVEDELLQRSHQPALLAEKFHRSSAILNQEFIKFEALIGPEQQDLLQEFKNLYAHDLQDQSSHSILTFLLQKAVQHKKKKLGLIPKPLKDNALLPSAPKVKDGKVVSARKPLKISVKKIVWQRANACCEHVDSKSQKRCSSKYALEADHIISIALGGTDEVENLRLLCRSHNSRRAIKTFGICKKSVD
jgi:hypothetical protein